MSNPKLLGKVKGMLLDGVSFSVIAENTGIHIGTISHLAQAWGIKRKLGRRKGSKDSYKRKIKKEK
jgi:hypothetical protein